MQDQDNYTEYKFKKKYKKKYSLVFVIILEIALTSKKTMGEGGRGLNDIFTIIIT